MPRSVTSVLLAALVALVPCEAGAGRPFVTEYAGVLDANDCEWENMAEQSRRAGEPRSRFAST